jgi:hypothetical protein
MFCATVLLDLDGPGTETQGERDISHPSREAPSPTRPAVQVVPGLFIGAKADRAGLDDLLLSSVEITERLQEYFIGC